MYSKDGKVIVSCVMTDDTEMYGNCATCRYAREWYNTRSIKEGEPGYCEHGDRFRERGEEE